jgi:hypothetical protein
MKGALRFLSSVLLAGILLTGSAAPSRAQQHATLRAHPAETFDIVCRDRAGAVVWTRHTHNMLTTAGANLYLASTIANGQAVSAEAEGNTGGSATVVTLTLLADQNGQASTIVPASLTSLTIASYTGTFSSNGKGVVSCSGACTNFTSGTLASDTGIVTLNFSSGGPNANAATATYSYIPAKWYVGLLYGASAPTFATSDTLASNGWSPAAEVTGTQVTNGTRPQFVLGPISAGSVSNSGSVAVYTGNATVTLQGLFVTNSSTLDGTASSLLGEATFTAAPIASGYTINVTVTDTVTPG